MTNFHEWAIIVAVAQCSRKNVLEVAGFVQEKVEIVQAATGMSERQCRAKVLCALETARGVGRIVANMRVKKAMKDASAIDVGPELELLASD